MRKPLHLTLASAASLVGALLLLAPATARAGGGVGCGFGSFEGTGDSLSIFSVFAAEQPEGAGHRIPVVAWVYEVETTGVRRGGMQRAVREALVVEKGSPEEAILKARLAPFLYDNERGERVIATFGEKQMEVGTTNDGGFTQTVLTLSAGEAGPLIRDGRLMAHFSVNGRTGGTFAIPVIPAEGVSVVSDIDDTVKLTEVLDREAMVLNTFTRPFTAVQGMAALYTRWSKERPVAFHYLSAGPWQLAEHLEPFLRESGFPEGILHLRPLRLVSPRSLRDFAQEGAASKTERITALFELFPRRTFILVGDSGERDPEVYGELARKHPDRVEAIYIRRVPGAENAAPRFTRAFEHVPAARVRLFDDPSEFGPAR